MVKVKKTVNEFNSNAYRNSLTSIFDLEDDWEDKIIEMGDALYSNGEEGLSKDLNDLLHDVYTDHDWEFAADVVNSIAQECESSEARRIGLELADNIRNSGL